MSIGPPVEAAPLEGLHRLLAEDDTRSLAARLAARLGPGDVVVLAGPLGAGKTLFVRGACVALEVDERDVTSPTYNLVHYYEGRLPVVHADLYRVQGRVSPEELGLAEELLEGEKVVFLEWPEPMRPYLPDGVWWVELEPDGEAGRRARVTRGLVDDERGREGPG